MKWWFLGILLRLYGIYIKIKEWIMGFLLESYEKEEAEAVVAAKALSSRIAELEAQVATKDANLAAAVLEVEALRSRPPVVVESDVVSVDFSPVLKKLDELLARPVASSSGGSDSENWNKLWVSIAKLMSDSNYFREFASGVRSRFGM